MDIIHIVSELSKIDWLSVLGAVSAILGGLIVIFGLIPGDQPEKTLKAIVRIIEKFSRK